MNLTTVKHILDELSKVPVGRSYTIYSERKDLIERAKKELENEIYKSKKLS